MRGADDGAASVARLAMRATAASCFTAYLLVRISSRILCLRCDATITSA